MSRRFETGNAQLIGNRMFQSNYFITDRGKEGVLAVLADGTIDSVNGMRAAVLACEVVRANFSKGGSFPLELFLLCQRTISSRIYLGRTPRVSLLAVWVEEERLVWRRVGNLRMYYYNHGNFVFAAEPEGCAKIDRGSRVLLCSGGVFGALSEAEIGRYQDTDLHPYEKSQLLMEMVCQKNKREQGNATVVMVEN